MTPPLQYSTYDNNGESKSIKRNKTYRKKPTKKVQNFLQAMGTESTMGDYTPVTNEGMEGKGGGLPKAQTYPLAYPQKPNPLSKKKEEDKSDTSIESFTQLPPSQPTNEYYKQYVPYYTNVENSSQLTGSNKNELMEKLNYMIHLLEEQQEDKTSNVAEELILYLFLGIFVIFVVDSFARAGSKYKR